MLLGHVAISALLHRYLKADLAPTMLGGIFPDILDKTLCQGLHITRSGRMVAHSLLSLVLTTLGIGLLRGQNSAWGWGVGYLAHLIADSNGFVPWFYPFRAYKFYHSQSSLIASFWNMLLKPRWLEWILIVWAITSFALGESKLKKHRTGFNRK